MLKNLEIEGFKSFGKDNIELSNLTILTGLNSSGKSSIIQAIRIWLEANRKSVGEYGLSLIDEFGGYSELKSKLSSAGKDIIIDLTNMEGIKSTFKISPESDNTTFTCHSKIGKSIASRSIDYIGANRLGPMSILPTIKNQEERIGIGEQGQFSVDYYLDFENLVVNEKILHPTTSSQIFSHQLEKWVGEIAPGTSLDFIKHGKHDISYIEINKYRAQNTGFGISYSLPIIMAVLAMSAGTKDNTKTDISSKAKRWVKNNSTIPPLLMIENPEAHLHPRGQTAMGKLLSLAASCGIQIIVETHSDHFLDGVRLEVRNSTLEPSQVGIYFLEQKETGESAKTKIEIDSKGKLKKWPKGFFDQSINNLRELTT